MTNGARAAKSLGMTRHLPGRGCGGSTERWRAAGAGLVCGTAAHHQEALSATSRESCRCARPTLSQLHLGKQAGTRAQSTFETDGRPPETHLWRPLASRMSHEEGGHTPRTILIIYTQVLLLPAPAPEAYVSFRAASLIKCRAAALTLCGPSRDASSSRS